MLARFFDSVSIIHCKAGVVICYPGRIPSWSLHTQWSSLKDMASCRSLSCLGMRAQLWSLWAPAHGHMLQNDHITMVWVQSTSMQATSQNSSRLSFLTISVVHSPISIPDNRLLSHHDIKNILLGTSHLSLVASGVLVRTFQARHAHTSQNNVESSWPRALQVQKQVTRCYPVSTRQSTLKVPIRTCPTMSVSSAWSEGKVRHISLRHHLLTSSKWPFWMLHFWRFLYWVLSSLHRRELLWELKLCQVQPLGLQQHLPTLRLCQ